MQWAHGFYLAKQSIYKHSPATDVATVVLLEICDLYELLESEFSNL